MVGILAHAAALHTICTVAAKALGPCPAHIITPPLLSSGTVHTIECVAFHLPLETVIIMYPGKAAHTGLARTCPPTLTLLQSVHSTQTGHTNICGPQFDLVV
eukprot:1156492-Pelagomonas_calceolata.AAC.8